MPHLKYTGPESLVYAPRKTGKTLEMKLFSAAALVFFSIHFIMYNHTVKAKVV